MESPTRSSILAMLVHDQVTSVTGSIIPDYLRLSRHLPALLLNSGLLASLEWLHRVSEKDDGQSDLERAARDLMRHMAAANDVKDGEQWLGLLRTSDVMTYQWHALRIHETSAWRKRLSESLLAGRVMA
jgi:hypothetical protein